MMLIWIARIVLLICFLIGPNIICGQSEIRDKNPSFNASIGIETQKQDLSIGTDFDLENPFGLQLLLRRSGSVERLYRFGRGRGQKSGSVLRNQLDSPDLTRSEREEPSQFEAGSFEPTVRISTALRPTYATFASDGIDLSETGVVLTGPSVALALRPFPDLPFSLTTGIGSGSSEREAHEVVPETESSKLASIEIYELRGAVDSGRFSITVGTYILRRPTEQEYISADGEIEFSDPNRTVGFNAEGSFNFNNHVTMSAGIMRIFGGDAGDQDVRSYVDTDPHRVVEAALVLRDLNGLDFNMTWRNVLKYGIEPTNNRVRTSNSNVFDFSARKTFRNGIEIGLLVDNLFNNNYYETESLFESKVSEFSSAYQMIYENVGYSRKISFDVRFSF